MAHNNKHPACPCGKAYVQRVDDGKIGYIADCKLLSRPDLLNKEATESRPSLGSTLFRLLQHGMVIIVFNAYTGVVVYRRCWPHSFATNNTCFGMWIVSCFKAHHQ